MGPLNSCLKYNSWLHSLLAYFSSINLFPHQQKWEWNSINLTEIKTELKRLPGGIIAVDAIVTVSKAQRPQQNYWWHALPPHLWAWNKYPDIFLKLSPGAREIAQCKHETLRGSETAWVCFSGPVTIKFCNPTSCVGWRPENLHAWWLKIAAVLRKRGWANRGRTPDVLLWRLHACAHIWTHMYVPHTPHIPACAPPPPHTQCPHLCFERESQKPTMLAGIILA